MNKFMKQREMICVRVPESLHIEINHLAHKCEVKPSELIRFLLYVGLVDINEKDTLYINKEVDKNEVKILYDKLKDKHEQIPEDYTECE